MATKKRKPRPPKPKHPHRHAVGSSIMDGNGYPTALTPERHKRLITELRVGDWPQMAAYRADVSPRSLSRWVVEGCDPFAVEPYKSFASDFVRVEAELSGRWITIIIEAAEGTTKPAKKDMRRPDPEHAKWLLTNRFRFLWAIDKEGRQGGMSVAESVERHMAQLDEARREKARAIIAKLPAETKQGARREGFLV